LGEDPFWEKLLRRGDFEEELLVEELLVNGDLEEELFIEELLANRDLEWLVVEPSFFDGFHISSM
jgi:hypothetical protein